MSDEISNDPEGRKILAEEEKTLSRVQDALAAVTRTHVRRDYDAELLELRDAMNEARMEDVPALLAEMERLREVANRRAELTVGKVDPSNPYFGHLKLTESGRVRDVLIGNSTYVDTDNGVRVVDWRDAPVSRVFYRYNEGDDYEEEFGTKLTEGTVLLRRAVVIRDGQLRRVVCPQGTFFRGRDGWQRTAAVAAKLAGGQLSAVRPPTDEERRAAKSSKGRLGVGVDGPEDKHLPEIPALIDPRQFELITKGSSGLVVIQGGAGSGKTTIGLHRMAYLAFNNPKRFSPDRMLVVVFNRALASYIVRVLPSLGVEGVQVTTYGEWISKTRQRHLPRTPDEYNDDTPSAVSRVKKHPMLLKLIDERVTREEAECLEGLREDATRLEMGELFVSAWRALDGNPLTRRLTGLGQWLRAERTLPGASIDAVAPRVRGDLQRAMDRWMKRARDIVWDWAELITDAVALKDAAARFAEGVFTDAELEQAAKWSAERVTSWVVAGIDAADEESAASERRAAKRGDRRTSRESREERKRLGDEWFENETIAADEGAMALKESRRGKDDEVHEYDDGVDQSRYTAIDGRREEEAPPAIDPEDDALLMRLYQRKRGQLRAQGKQPMLYEHTFVDEAQDLSPIELSVLLGVSTEDRSVTLAGDTAQRLLMDNGFSDWKGVLSDLGLNTVEVEPLKIGYRSTMEVLAFAREVLGRLADPDPPLATRQGAPVEFHSFGDVGAAVAFLAESLRALMLDEPRANVAVISRDAERADVYFDGLKKAEVPYLKRVADQDFSFRPGVEVTDIRQVKGLEFDYVILVDVTRSQYPVDDESRHLLHIGATRAAHQLWVISPGLSSPLLPAWMIDD